MHPTKTNNLRNAFLLDPQVIYLNHGSFGATPRPVFERYLRWQRELEAQPTEFLGRRAGELLAHSREVLAEYLGTFRDNLVYVTNATTGLNIVARSLHLQPGDEILTTDHEYGALDRTWRFLSQKQGPSGERPKYINQTIPVPVNTSGDFLDAFWQGVTPNTRVIFLSHITSPTALIFPVQEVCRRAREAGILTIVDGAHAPGQIDLNLDELGADFYSGNLHKWLCAPKGAAFLFARPEVQPMIEPLVVSWGWDSGKAQPSPLVDYLEWAGTRDISAFLTVPDAIQYQRENDWEAVRCGCHELACEALHRVTRLTGLDPLSPVSAQWFSQMVSIPLPAECDAAQVKDRLYRQFRIEIPIIEWNGRKLARCSIQAYNTLEDVIALESALREIMGDLGQLSSIKSKI